jgi:hypothetical protein
MKRKLRAKEKLKGNCSRSMMTGKWATQTIKDQNTMGKKIM